MKFIHMADMHFDTPFTTLNNLGEERRLEQRQIFKQIIEYIKENNIPYLFISGDLYDHTYVKESTIEYINELFKKIPGTNIFISPGNHDPYIKNSYYNNYNWSENVHIFTNKKEKFEKEGINIYGYGFADFYCENSRIEEIQIENKNEINILVLHASLDASTLQEKKYNPITKNQFKKIGFDYIALGHIHKLSYKDEEKQTIIYPGSTIALGFDEPGEHGVILGEISKEKLDLEFIKFDKKEFEKIELNISGINSEEELIEKINNLILEAKKYYEIILTGNKNIEINTYTIIKHLENKNIIKIKDKTKIEIDIEKQEKEKNLKGYFIKEINELKKDKKIDEEILNNVLEIGINILNNN